MTHPVAPPPVRFESSLGGWAVSTAAEARRVLADEEAFSTTAYRQVGGDLAGTRAFLAADSAAHSRLRRVLASAMSQAWVSRVERDTLDPLAEAGARALDPGEADLAAEYARPYARKALFAVTGIDATAGDELLAALRFAHDRFDEAGRNSETGLAAVSIARRIAAEALVGPTADPTTLRSRLYAAEALSADEQVLCLLPLFETLAIGADRDLPISLVLRIGALDPAAQALATSSPARIQAAAHEAVRLQTGATIPRFARRDVTLAGESIPAGSLVFVLLDRVGCDPALFDNAGEFDPSRANLGRHPGFGAGPHSCVGRRFAIALAGACVRALVRRFEIDLARPSTVARLSPRSRRPTQGDA